MKIGIDLKPFFTGSKYRGIGKYSRELINNMIEEENSSEKRWEWVSISMSVRFLLLLFRWNGNNRSIRKHGIYPVGLHSEWRPDI